MSSDENELQRGDDEAIDTVENAPNKTKKRKLAPPKATKQVKKLAIAESSENTESLPARLLLFILISRFNL
jgi:hypothetical protein